MRGEGGGERRWPECLVTSKGKEFTLTKELQRGKTNDSHNKGQGGSTLAAPHSDEKQTQGGREGKTKSHTSTNGSSTPGGNATAEKATGHEVTRSPQNDDCKINQVACTTDESHIPTHSRDTGFNRHVIDET